MEGILPDGTFCKLQYNCSYLVLTLSAFYYRK